jgi:ATP-dependent RNA helicase DeaD
MGDADLLGQAQTGTGKTAAFALPLLNKLDLSQRLPQVLVLTPTRELAIQVAEAFQSYSKYLEGFHVLPIYGGQSMVQQLRQLDRGAHVIVGTPGRVMDHLERKSLSLENLKTVVLDEADEMLRMGFIDDVEWILDHTPAERQVALFSATMPEQIRRVANSYLKEPQEVKIKSNTSTVATIRQRYWQVSGLHKLDALTRMLEVEDELDAAIIFVRTKTETVLLAEKLEARGYAAAALNGDLTQPLRERTIEQLKSGKLDIIVATDVAARGIDVPRISHVINYDIPYDTEAYVHRIGRTGRAGRQGTAILFVAPREMRMLRTIERATRQPIEPMPLPTREAVANRRVQQFKEQIGSVLETEDLTFFTTVVEQMKEEQDVELVDIAAALAYLVQKERPLELPEAARRADVQEASAMQNRRDGGRREWSSDDRGGRGGERAERGERPSRDGGRREWNREPREGQVSDDNRGNMVNLVRYRIEVGRNQEISPKDIVGAIANEAGIQSRLIGAIRLFDDHSTVELPSLNNDTFNLLKRVRVRRFPLNLSLADPSSGDSDSRGGFGGAPRENRGEGGFRKSWDGNKKPRGERTGGGNFGGDDRSPFRSGSRADKPAYYDQHRNDHRSGGEQRFHDRKPRGGHGGGNNGGNH